jgi:TPP-dependent pyruvate/acetoin dehydrogenase alpha subunit
MGNRNRGQGESKTGAAAPDGGGFSLISNDKLIALYTHLLQCRDTARRGALSNSSSLRGREAALVGAAIDLGPSDVVCSRVHGLLPGVSGATINKLLLEWNHHPQPGSAHDAMMPAVAARRNGFAQSQDGLVFTHAALGAALVHKTKKNRNVAVVFCVQDTGSLGEALEIATVHALPMIFLNELNGNAEKRERKSRSSEKKDSPWFPSITVDGNDVVAVYRVAGEAISRARLGRGPTLIECRPFRLTGQNGRHTRDPIRIMEHYLRAKGLFHPKLKSDAIAAFE